jgi:hypothetical protein
MLLPFRPGIPARIACTTTADRTTIINFRISRISLPPAIALLLVLLASASTASAGAFAPAGDLALRHDIQVLADHGLITSPVTSWPMSWDAIAADLGQVDEVRHPQEVRVVLQRVRARIERNTRRGDLSFTGRVGVAEKPTAIRGFAYTPREDAEITGGIVKLGERLSLDLKVTAVDSPADGKDVRADGSEIGVRLGNFVYAASVTDRWWGPGWDGSLILSNNARPVPAFTIRRNTTQPFETKWLNWLGPWDLRVIWGQMEKERAVPDTRFFGMRFNFKPLQSLEIGLSRTAQWCGDGRPCGFDTFVDLFFGNDNAGEGGVTQDNEAGNQLAGFDIRWTNTWFDVPMALYVQFIGEDEAGFLPSRNLAMGGVEFSGWAERRLWSYRVFAEIAGTSCDVLEEDRFNCAYNHGIYQTGYRYRGRVVGHPAENDALISSLGFVLMTENANRWNFLLRSGELNRGGAPDDRNTLTAVPLDTFSADLSYSHGIGMSRLDIGVGFERLDDNAAGTKTDHGRAFVQWSYGF